MAKHVPHGYEVGYYIIPLSCKYWAYI